MSRNRRKGFAAIQRWYQYNAELENWKLDYERWQVADRKTRDRRPPVPPPEPELPPAEIDEVLGPVFIRRRRQDIRELYGDDVEVDGKPVRFPTAELHNLQYRLDKVYEKAFPFEELHTLLAAHQGARYLAVTYLLPEARGKEQYRDLIRASARVATLMRFLLVKRLESSVAAFRATLQVLTRSNRNFRRSLEEGFVPVGQTATSILSGDAFEVEELLERLREEEGRRQERGSRRARMVHPTSDFDLERWLSDLDADHAVLTDLLARLESIEPEDDDKLQRLKEFLAQPEVTGGKVLIFSEAEATIDYLFGQLNAGGTDPTIARLSGASRDTIQSVVKRFSPDSNLRLREPEVRILPATDVVSEGQNLQDCNRVLNYDLHWNPVRLIQRFGRVDRIGTQHETIHLHNTWPDTEADRELTLTERLLHRIQAFHDMIGLDAPLLSQSERINPRGMYAIYEQRRLPGDDEDSILDDVTDHQRGVALLQNLEKNNPDLWTVVTTLPDGIRSAVALPPPPRRDAFIEQFVQESMLEPVKVQMPLTLPTEEAGVQTALDDPRAGETVVLLEQGDARMAYAVGSELQPRRITLAQLVRAVTCEPETPAETLPRKTNKRVMAAFERARIDVSQRLGTERRPTSDTKLRRYLNKQFRQLREQYRGNDEELKRIGVLQQIFPDHVPARALEELNEVRRLEIVGDGLIRRLEALRARHRLNPAGEDEGAYDGSEVGVLRIVCSDGLE